MATIEMHGQGNFFDPRLDNSAQFPIAAANGFDYNNLQNLGLTASEKIDLVEFLKSLGDAPYK